MGAATSQPPIEVEPEHEITPSSFTRFVVLQHGMGGRASDLDAVRHNLKREAAKAAQELEVWESKSNERRTHDGVERCAMRIWKELQPRLTDVLTTSGAKLVRVSFVGHSLGGLMPWSLGARFAANV